MREENWLEQSSVAHVHSSIHNVAIFVLISHRFEVDAARANHPSIDNLHLDNFTTAKRAKKKLERFSETTARFASLISMISNRQGKHPEANAHPVRHKHARREESKEGLKIEAQKKFEFSFTMEDEQGEWSWIWAFHLVIIFKFCCFLHILKWIREQYSRKEEKTKEKLEKGTGAHYGKMDLTFSISSEFWVDRGTPNLITSFIWSELTPGIDPASKTPTFSGEYNQNRRSAKPLYNALIEERKKQLTPSKSRDGIGRDGVAASAHRRGGNILPAKIEGL